MLFSLNMIFNRIQIQNVLSNFYNQHIFGNMEVDFTDHAIIRIDERLSMYESDFIQNKIEEQILNDLDVYYSYKEYDKRINLPDLTSFLIKGVIEGNKIVIKTVYEKNWLWKRDKRK